MYGTMSCPCKILQTFEEAIQQHLVAFGRTFRVDQACYDKQLKGFLVHFRPLTET
jgi:hypothetical protein